LDLLTISIIIGLSFLLGVVFVNYLTNHPLKMSIYLIISCFSFFTIIVVLISSFKSNFIILGIEFAFTFVSFIVGYFLMAKRILSMNDDRYIPPILRTKDDPGGGHTAVVYFTHGEPETYNPIGWINQFREFDDQNIPFVPFAFRPFFLFQLRRKYLQVGKSDHRKMHQIMIKDLEERFRDEGDNSTKFYLSFLDDDPRPDAAVIQALNEGASQIIVCEVFVSLSSHTCKGEELITDLKIQNYGVPLQFTTPLWDSGTLHTMFVEKVNKKLAGIDKEVVAILLVGHGQPNEWDKLFPTATEHEIRFRNNIIDLFKKDGYLEENLGLAWMEFKEPRPKEKIEEFVKNGVEYILYFATSISADAIHSMSDIPSLIHEADIPKQIKLINMGAWNNHPLVIRSIKERIDSLMIK